MKRGDIVLLDYPYADGSGSKVRPALMVQKWTVLRYVERNAVGAVRVARAEDWRWSGLWARNHGDDAIQAMLSPWPLERPVD